MVFFSLWLLYKTMGAGPAGPAGPRGPIGKGQDGQDGKDGKIENIDELVSAMKSKHLDTLTKSVDNSMKGKVMYCGDGQVCDIPEDRKLGSIIKKQISESVGEDYIHCRAGDGTRCEVPQNLSLTGKKALFNTISNTEAYPYIDGDKNLLKLHGGEEGILFNGNTDVNGSLKVGGHTNFKSGADFRSDTNFHHFTNFYSQAIFHDRAKIFKGAEIRGGLSTHDGALAVHGGTIHADKICNLKGTRCLNLEPIAGMKDHGMSLSDPKGRYVAIQDDGNVVQYHADHAFKKHLLN